MRETTSSLPRLTAAALSRALNLEQGSRLLTVRLPGAVDAEDLAKCFTLNGNGVPDICELEPGNRMQVMVSSLQCLSTHQTTIAQTSAMSKKTAPRSSIIWSLATLIFATGVLLFGACMLSPFRAALEQPWYFPPIYLIKLNKHARF